MRSRPAESLACSSSSSPGPATTTSVSPSTRTVAEGWSPPGVVGGTPTTAGSSLRSITSWQYPRKIVDSQHVVADDACGVHVGRTSPRSRVVRAGSAGPVKVVAVWPSRFWTHPSRPLTTSSAPPRCAFLCLTQHKQTTLIDFNADRSRLVDWTTANRRYWPERPHGGDDDAEATVHSVSSTERGRQRVGSTDGGQDWPGHRTGRPRNVR
jgi:hypothetical protein